MIKFEALVRDGTKFKLRLVYLNPTFIVLVRESEILTRDLRSAQKNNKFPEGLSKEHVLSEVVYAEGNSAKSLLAIGSPESIRSKMFAKESKTLLRG